MATLDFVDEELAALEARGRRRGVRVVGGRRGAEVQLDGRWVVSFSSNDYLGLSTAPEVVEAAREALGRHGVGAGGSRLVNGTTDEVVALERELAAHHGTEAALVFGSAYAANTGVIPALVGRGDAVFSDELNHASLVDGCRLSRAEVRVWPHRDVGALRALLAEGRWRRRLIVTESVFSMDGDQAPLEELAAVARANDAMLLVDDAHAVGVVGGRGEGAGGGAGADVVVGAMGKALGSAGGYVAARAGVVQLVWNRARSLVFSTAQPPAVVAASRAALTVVRSGRGEELRGRLAGNVRRLRARLVRLARGGAGGVAERGGPIVPVVLGDDRRAVSWTEALLAEGLFVQAIRPPTVPEGTARLRVCVSALHEPEQLDRLAEALERLAG